jgi:hypothetical protein
MIITDDTGTLRVTIAGDLGISPTGIAVASDGEIVCEICAFLAAGNTIEAWIYSTPRLAAAVRVDLDAQDQTCPYLRIPIGAPLDGQGPITPGPHTLQLRMATTNGLEILSIPIDVTTATRTGTGTGTGAGAPVPNRVNTGGGPVPLMPMPLALSLLTATLALTLIQRDRDHAWATAWATRPRRDRTIPGRRLTAFDDLEHRLHTFRNQLHS